jgi:lysophospholipase L1-like esterase
VTGAKKGPSTRAKLVFSFGLAFFFFAVLEIGARAVGAGDPMAFGGSRLLYQHIYPPLFVEKLTLSPPLQTETPRAVWRPRDPRLVDRSTPKTGTRVFVFGESAVAGLGMSENASFSRALERHLRRAGDKTTVTNVGIVALDSRQVQTCLKDCCKNQKPEVVVLHVGNNEFLEVHAQKFLKARGKPFAVTLDEIFSNSAFFLALKNKAEAARNAHLTQETFSTQSLRMSEHELVKEKATTVAPEEIDAAVKKHLANMKRTIEIAKQAGAKVILMTVATNLEWSGSQDPKEGWLAKACGKPVPETGDERTNLLRAALDSLQKTIDDAAKDPLDRWEARYGRGVVRRALGDSKGALEELQKANDEDPHLRRCLSVMNENMRALAREEGCVLVDGAKVLAEQSKDGICGFDMLYDYVHFTPAGSERLGAALAQALLGDQHADELKAWVKERDDALSARTQDALEVEEYYGWNSDRSMLSSRDLWKYDNGRDALDKKAAEGNPSPEELVWCANAHALRVSEEKRARDLYEEARKKKPELGAVIDSNLKWLDAR